MSIPPSALYSSIYNPASISTPVSSAHAVTATPALSNGLQSSASLTPSASTHVHLSSSASSLSLNTTNHSTQHSKEPITDDHEAEGLSDQGLTPDELALVRELSARDQEVRQHEQAHASVGGPHTGGVELDYSRGPDGRLYAVSGEVSVDMSAVAGDPLATKEKMETVIRAALAPAEPSTQDRKVAAKAQAMLAQAVVELAKIDEEAEADVEERPESASMDGRNGTAAESDASAVSGTERAVKGISLDQKLVDAGVFQRLFDVGSVIDQQV